MMPSGSLRMALVENPSPSPPMAMKSFRMTRYRTAVSSAAPLAIVTDRSREPSAAAES
jgi:hypothetical protein